MHEFQIISNYFKKLTKNNKNALNLNDDIFFDKRNNLAVSVDTYIEGTHFINFKNPELVVKKILRSSISDLICKGVVPKYYFVSGSGNKNSFNKSNLSKISKSLNEEQQKYKVYLGGGDTIFSKKISFTITSIGYCKNIIYRNKATQNDDLYVTGNLGDSYIGLLILKKKLKLSIPQNKYFINKYYKPEIHLKLVNELKKFASSSIDISDGLFNDLEKLINQLNISYKVKLKDIPISKNLSLLIKNKNLLKKNLISNGDDYQILFTAPKRKRLLIKNISKSSRIRITKIGKILNKTHQSSLLDEKNKKITLKNKGYFHNFS
jgi:thiamine-monophosphate kinase